MEKNVQIFVIILKILYIVKVILMIMWNMNVLNHVLILINFIMKAIKYV